MFNNLNKKNKNNIKYNEIINISLLNSNKNFFNRNTFFVRIIGLTISFFFDTDLNSLQVFYETGIKKPYNHTLSELDPDSKILSWKTTKLCYFDYVKLFSNSKFEDEFINFCPHAIKLVNIDLLFFNFFYYNSFNYYLNKFLFFFFFKKL